MLNGKRSWVNLFSVIACVLLSFTTTISAAASSFVTGTYVGDGVDNRAISLGFQPDVVFVKGTDSLQIRTSTMTAARDFANAGGSTTSADRIKSITSTGFTIGTGSSVNSSGTTYFYFAFNAVAGETAVGTYTGNGADNRSITGIGFQPDMVMTMRDTAACVWRSSAMTGDFTSHWDSTAPFADGIQALEASGFQVGTSAFVNNNTSTFHYIACKSVTGKFKVGTYTGTGVNASITGVGFQPEAVFVKRGSTTTARFRLASTGSASDATLPTNPGGITTGTINIPSLDADGFSVGTTSSVNTATAPNDYYYFAWKNQPPSLAPVPTVTSISPNNGITTGGTVVTITGTGFTGATAVSFGGTAASIFSVTNDTTISATTAAHAAGSGLNVSVTAPGGTNTANTLYSYVAPFADLSITCTDGVTTVAPGGTTTYTITVTNLGPSAVTGATVADTFPASLTATWTGVGAGGGTGPASGSGNINASVNLPVGGSFTFTVSASISVAATGSLVNTATIASQSGVPDPIPANDASTDVDTITAPAFVVTTNADSGAGSLRTAITSANATTGATITFDPTFFASAQTIQLASTLTITQPMTITGPGAKLCTVAGTATSSVNSFGLMNSTATSGVLAISGLSFTAGGNTATTGSAINFAPSSSTIDASLTACEFFSNFGTGRCVYALACNSYSLTGCTFRNGGHSSSCFSCLAAPGGVNFTNCTFANNATNSSVACLNFAPNVNQSYTATIVNCTFTQNAGFGLSASESNTGASVSVILRNNVFSGNATNFFKNTGTPFTTSNNISSDNSIPLIGTGDRNNTPAIFGTVGDYGGPVQTVPLLPGSPAINAGTATGAPTTDARGIARVGTTDIGAFEAQAITLALSSGNNQSANLISTFTNPLVVSVTGTGGDPVNGGVVTFTAPGSGASLNPATSMATISSGSASLTVIANATAGGPYTVAATAAGASPTINFSLTNTIGAFVVTTNADSGAGSLRTAITSANTTTGATITFDPMFFATQKTITLASALPTINANMTITGPGANLCTVSGNSLYVPFSTNAANLNVSISGLTVSNGVSSSYGGGLNNASTGTVSLTNVVFQNNTSGIGTGGGGVCNVSTGTLNLSGCLFTNNTAINGTGGGAYNSSTGTLNIINCTFSGNQATITGGGGAVGAFTTGPIVMTSCTVVGNTAPFGGGLISNLASALTIKNCLVANNTSPNGPDINFDITSSGNNLIGNTSTSSGFVGSDVQNVVPLVGTLGFYPASAAIQTIPLLPGSPAINAGASGGAVPTTDARGIARVGATDIGAFEAQAFTLALSSGNNQSATLISTFTNPLVVSVTGTGGDPVNGGVVTFTAPGSGASLNPATSTATISSGSASLTATANATAGGPYTVTATAVGATPTINFSLTNTAAAFVVTNNNDSGAGSLRAAITSANATTGALITFDPTFFATQKTIQLASTLPTLNASMTITGPGANLCTVSGNNAIQPLSTNNTNLTLSISGLTIANGLATQVNNGGGLRNFSSGTMTLSNIVFSNNTTSPAGSGGAIYHASAGTLILTGCLFRTNSAVLEGGAIYHVSTGTITATNCTFTGNSSNLGGAIRISTTGLLNLTNCTLTSNTAALVGGIFNSSGGTVTLKNTLIAQNTGGAAPDISGSVTSLGNNLIGNSTTGIGFVGSDLLNITAPLVGTLGFYPASAIIQTVPLLPGSPAINAGTATGAPTTDARGIARVGATDIGAFEAQAITLALSSGNNQSAYLISTFTNPLVVSVTGTGGDPVNGGVVTFTAPGSGASLNPATSTATISSGSASLTATANATAGGPYTVAATAAGASPTINFSLTNTAAAFVVTNNNDSGTGSLRDCITQANATTGATITFDPTFFATQKTITLASKLPTIRSDMTITGPGASLCIVNGNNAFRVFSIGVVPVSISGLTVANGYDVLGGGIYTGGTLTLSNCVITGCTASLGAGLRCDGVLIMTACTVSNNITGGGLVVSGASTTVTGCTFSGNTGVSGLAINLASGTLTTVNTTFIGNTGSVAVYLQGTGVSTMTNCTLTGNNAGILLNTGTCTFTNCISVGNTGLDVEGTNLVNASSSNNLFGTNTGTGLTNGTNGNQLGVSAANARLGTLGFYPASATVQTIPLLPGSPAIDAGTDTGAPTTDARGIARVGTTDIGAFEAQAITLALSSGNNQSKEISTAFTNPLVVSVTGTGGDPVNGGVVTFTAPGSGASLNAATSTATISSGSASLSATANATAGGPYTVAATATGASPTINFSLTNLSPVALSTLSTTAWTINTSGYSGTITVSGGNGSYTLGTVTGLPTGLSAVIAGSTITISGTPTATASTPNNVSITVNDTVGGAVTQTFTLTINPAISITTTTLPNWTMNTSGYSQTVASTGGTGTVTFAVTAGTAPTGLTLATNGALTGTPTATGTFNFTVTATDTVGATGAQAYSIVINPAISYSALSVTAWTVNTSGYSGTVSVSGGTGAYSGLNVTGLPTGLSAAISNGIITISGTPTATASTANNVSITVNDSVGATTTQTSTLTINPGLSFGVLTTTAWTQNYAGYSGTVAVSGGTGTYLILSIDGLPAGLTVLLANSVATITGTPTATVSSANNVSLMFSDLVGATITQSFTLTINPAITIPATTLPNPVVNVAGYSQTITGTGGTGALTYSVTNGSIPTGMSFSTSGVLNGTPNIVNESVTFTVTATDSLGATGTQTYSLAVSPPITFTSGPTINPNPTYRDLATTFTATASSPTNPNATIIWNFGDGSPTATGNRVTHIYSVAGFYTVTVTAIDQSGNTMQPASRAQGGGSVSQTLQLEVKDLLGNGSDFLNGTGQLTISSGLIRLYPSLVTLKGTMPLGANETLAGKTFTISVNNLSRSYTLDKNGNAKGYGGKISVKRNGAPAGRANFTYTLSGFLTQSLSDTVGQDSKSRPTIALIQIQLNGNTSSYLTPLTYVTPHYPGLAKFGNKNVMPL